MITTKEQETLLVELSRKITRTIVAYAIGGNAMMYWGLKDATVDIDVVFSQEGDRKEFQAALRSLGFAEVDAAFVYGDKDNQPILMKRTEQERFDLFLEKVIRLNFSQNMKERAEKIYAYGNTLVIKAANYHDIILMKCVTDRAKDKEDIKTMVEKQKVDWNIIAGEARKQFDMGNKTAVFDILQTCQQLKNDMGVNIPEQFLSKIWDIFSSENPSHRAKRKREK